MSNYKEIVANLLSSFQDVGANMIIKLISYRGIYLDHFPESLGVSE